MAPRTPLLVFSAALAVLLTLTVTCSAQDIRKGAALHVKPNSIWFQDQAMFDEWQRLRKSGDAAALKSYEDGKLGNRDAWQFIYEMAVRVIKYDSAKRQVDVEMTTPGRMQGSAWIVDADAIQDEKLR
jgi:hypothetical protein